MPPNFEWGFAGDVEMMQEAGAAMGLALVLAMAFIYIVLASQFESFLEPFLIMTSLPLALVGALLALLLTGRNIGMPAMIGVVMLMGLVTKNAILLVDLTNQYVREGLSVKDAILKAGPVRLRPILMTTIAMILGMLPSAIGTGEGSGFRSPISIATIGGLITSTLLTLVVVPVVVPAARARGRAREGAAFDAGPRAAGGARRGRRAARGAGGMAPLDDEARLRAHRPRRCAEPQAAATGGHVADVRPGAATGAVGERGPEGRAGEGRRNPGARAGGEDQFPAAGEPGLLVHAVAALPDDPHPGRRSSDPRSRRSRRRSRARTACSCSSTSRSTPAAGCAASTASRPRRSTPRSSSSIARARRSNTASSKPYYAALMNERGVAVADEQIRLSEKQLELAKARFESGTVARLDVLQAEVELANAKARRIQTKAQVDASMQALRSVLSLPQTQPLQLTGSLDEPVVGHAREELDQQLPQRPDLRAFDARRDAAEYLVAAGRQRVEAEPVVHREHAISAGLRRIAAGARQPELPVRRRVQHAAVRRARRGGAPRRRAVADAAGGTRPALRDRQRAARARNGVDGARGVGRGRDDAGEWRWSWRARAWPSRRCRTRTA